LEVELATVSGPAFGAFLASNPAHLDYHEDTGEYTISPAAVREWFTANRADLFGPGDTDLVDWPAVAGYMDTWNWF
jgi:hypothetical protein